MPPSIHRHPLISLSYSLLRNQNPNYFIRWKSTAAASASVLSTHVDKKRHARIHFDSMHPNGSSISEKEKDKNEAVKVILDPQSVGQWRQLHQCQHPRDYLQAYLALSKSRLATLVVLTTMAGYAMAPGTCSLAASSGSPALLLLWTTVGTASCVMSANTLNQWMEIPFDSQMTRTRGRPLVRWYLSSGHAMLFGLGMGAMGVGMLATLVHPLTAVLGGLNILLYTGVYTPMKRFSIANTWVGSVVGAIPPMMGWTAVTGELGLGAWLLGGLLYAWQFPHFNSLSWALRKDYARAGYRMMVVTDPQLNARVSLRYSLALFPLCMGLTYADVTSACFVATSSIPNAVMTYYAWKFWKEGGDQNARKLFMSSLFHLPALILLMLVHKRWPRSDERTQNVDKLVHEPFGVKSSATQPTAIESTASLAHELHTQ